MRLPVTLNRTYSSFISFISFISSSEGFRLQMAGGRVKRSARAEIPAFVSAAFIRIRQQVLLSPISAAAAQTHVGLKSDLTDTSPCLSALYAFRVFTEPNVSAVLEL